MVNSRKGFSLIEVCLAIFLLFIGLTFICSMFIVTTAHIRDQVDAIRGRTTANSVQELPKYDLVPGWNVLPSTIMNGYSSGRAIYRNGNYPDQEFVWIWNKIGDEEMGLIDLQSYTPVKGHILLSCSGYSYVVEKNNEMPNIRSFESSSIFLLIKSDVVLVKVIRWYRPNM